MENLRVEFRTGGTKAAAITDLSLRVGRGESYGLVGESGCGKTTLAMAIMGYLGRNGAVTRGQIMFEGEDLAAATPSRMTAIRGRRIAMVYQDPGASLNPTMTVGRQLAEVPMLLGCSSRGLAMDQVLEVLGDVRMPDPQRIVGRYPHQLSGGQMQRVVIAMALLAQPALLLLDEPTTGLDVTVEAAVIDLIVTLRAKYATSLIYISHNLGLIATACDRVGIMYSGELVEEAPVATLFRRPLHPYTVGLLDCVPNLAADKRSRTLRSIPGQFPLPNERPMGCVFGPRCDGFVAGRCDLGPIPMEDSDRADHILRCVRWREIEAAGKAVEPGLQGYTPVAGEHPILDVDRMSKSYEIGTMAWARRRPLVLRANEDLSFSVDRGQILAVVGESGCGKSTFARVLTGLQTANSGNIFFADQNIAAQPVQRRSREMKRAIQMIFQNPDSTLNPSHTVAYAVRRSITKAGVRRGAREVAERVGQLFGMVQLPAQFQGRRPEQLSGGQKQRIAIARAFASEPDLIVADEPVSALDVSVQAAIVTLLLDLQTRARTTLIVISHDLALVRHVADKVVVMYAGRIMEQGTADEVFAGPWHPYTEALLSAIPVANPDQRRANPIRLRGEVPSPIDPPPGCRFASRCPRKIGPICDYEPPPERMGSKSHRISCHILLEELATVQLDAPISGY